MKLIAACLYLVLSLNAQTMRWESIVSPIRIDRLERVQLTDAQLRGIKTLLKAEIRGISQWCDDMSWVDSLQASRIAIGPPGTILLEAGGCMRGGQGANGSMWLVRWSGARPALLGEFAGYPYRVLPQTSHGLHDVTVGWHMSAREFYLSLYRFDGNRYREAGKKDIVCGWDEPDRCEVRPVLRLEPHGKISGAR